MIMIMMKNKNETTEGKIIRERRATTAIILKRGKASQDQIWARKENKKERKDTEVRKQTQSQYHEERKKDQELFSFLPIHLEWMRCSFCVPFLAAMEQKKESDVKTF